MRIPPSRDLDGNPQRVPIPSRNHPKHADVLGDPGDGTRRAKLDGSPRDIPELSFWQRLPKGSLVRILVLLALLAGIVYLQMKSENFFGGVERTLSPIGTQNSDSPRVKMAPILPPVAPDRAATPDKETP